MSIEHQNAFELSRIERATREPDEHDIKIRELLKAGRFVVCEDMIVYCRFTDATLGVDYSYLADFESYERACAHVDSLAGLVGYSCDGISIKCPEGFKYPEPEYDPDNDLPF